MSKTQTPSNSMVTEAMSDDIVCRLRKRAEIRRSIPDRKSVLEGKPDRIADLLEDAADEIERLRAIATPDTDGDTCAKCDDSGYQEFISGGLGGGFSSRRLEICDCPCGDDVRRQADTDRVAVLRPFIEAAHKAVAMHALMRAVPEDQRNDAGLGGYSTILSAAMSAASDRISFHDWQQLAERFAALS